MINHKPTGPQKDTIDEELKWKCKKETIENPAWCSEFVENVAKLIERVNVTRQVRKHLDEPTVNDVQNIESRHQMENTQQEIMSVQSKWRPSISCQFQGNIWLMRWIYQHNSQPVLIASFQN